MFKAFCVSLIEKKPIKTSKARSNLIFITVPTILLYLLQLSLKTYIHSLSKKEQYEMEHLMIRFFISAKIEQMTVHFFITFMVISRCMRALVKVLEDMRGDKDLHRI